MRRGGTLVDCGLRIADFSIVAEIYSYGNQPGNDIMNPESAIRIPQSTIF